MIGNRKSMFSLKQYQTMSIGITEVFAGEAVCFKNIVWKKYQLALQFYSLTVNPEWIHTYTYAVNELWGREGGFVTIDEKENFVFEKHYGVVVLVRRKDGKFLTHAEITDLRRQIVWQRNTHQLATNAPILEGVREDVQRLRYPSDIVLAIMTDTHYTVGGNWPSLLSCLQTVSKWGLDGIVHLGDFTDGMVAKETTSVEPHPYIVFIII